MAGGRRPAGPPHPAPRSRRQLLAHRPARARRPVLGDLRRPRAGVRPRRRPGRRRGPLPGDLEPGLHAGGDRGRQEQGRLPRRRRAAEEEHRHRHGDGAGRLPAAGRRQHVRDRPGLPGAAARSRARRQEVRPAREGCARLRRRRPAAGGGRPRAQRVDAHRRRRQPVQRGPGLCRAAAAASRCPVDAVARGRRADASRAAPRKPGRDEGRVPRGRTRLRPDRGRRVRGGGGVPAHAAHRHPDLRHGGGPDQARRQVDAAGGDRVQAARHLRLPDRPHPGDGGRAGDGGRRGRVPPADGRTAPQGQGGRPAQEDRSGGPVGVPRTRRRARPARRVHRLRRGGQFRHRPRPAARRPADGGGRGGRRGRGRARPHAVLRRVRRPGRRHRGDQHRFGEFRGAGHAEAGRPHAVLRRGRRPARRPGRHRRGRRWPNRGARRPVAGHRADRAPGPGS